MKYLFYPHQATGARVTGLDLSCNMVGLALEKLHKQNIPKVTTDLQLVRILYWIPVQYCTNAVLTVYELFNIYTNLSTRNVFSTSTETVRSLTMPVLLAWKRQVQFEVGNAVTTDLSGASFDAAYSRDAILHIPFELRVALFQNTLVSCELTYNQ